MALKNTPEDLRFRSEFRRARRKFLADKKDKENQALIDEYGTDAQRARRFMSEYMKRNDGGIARKTRMF